MTSRDPFTFGDGLGPAEVVHLHDPASGLRGIVVVDSVACGPAIGGVRMAASELGGTIIPPDGSPPILDGRFRLAPRSRPPDTSKRCCEEGHGTPHQP